MYRFELCAKVSAMASIREDHGALQRIIAQFKLLQTFREFGRSFQRLVIVEARSVPVTGVPSFFPQKGQRTVSKHSK
jgi:hypothetical protein